MRTHRTIKPASILASSVAVVALLLLFAAPAAAGPVWRLDVVSNPTAQEGSEVQYRILLANVGDTSAPEVPGGNSENCVPGALPDADPDTPDPDPSKCITFTATLPVGLTPTEIVSEAQQNPFCALAGQTVTCTIAGSSAAEVLKRSAGEGVTGFLRAAVDPGASGTLTASFRLEGGGAAAVETLAATRLEPGLPDFGFGDFDSLAKANADGDHHTQAASAPYAVANNFELNSIINPDLLEFAPGGQTLWPVEPPKDIVLDVPAGLVGNPTILDECTFAELANGREIFAESLCPIGSQAGTIEVHTSEGQFFFHKLPLFNMVPASGSPARFGFNLFGTVVAIDATVRSESDYGITFFNRNTSQGLPIQGVNAELWGVPADPSHDFERACPGERQPERSGPACESGNPLRSFLRMPTACTAAGEGLEWSIRADSWENPGDFEEASIESHDPPTYPADPDTWGDHRGPEGCEKVPVKGTLKAKPTSIDTETASGLGVHVEVPNPNFENPKGIVSSDIKRVKVALPQGLTINPSQAEGLGVCSPSQYESTVLSFFPTPGKGCPDDSKIGSVSVVSPLLEETIPGDVYIAKPYENPFNSLLAIYIVLAEPQRGILAKLPGEVRTNEQTGRIEAEFDDLPQLPFSTFDFKFREGARAPLITPSTCGTYETVTEIEGWSAPGEPIESKSSFEITRGIGGGPCPSGGTPGFKPGFSAGSINNNAGDFSPFVMRLTRLDGEQDMTRFSAVLPPGVLGKLAGVDKCPNSAAAIAKSKTGLEERANPSCPANSQIGRSLVGAGVGSVLTHVPGKIYLGGPFNGRPLSVIAITPAVAGPFDVGTVVVQEALNLNPKTAEVEVDGSASDPIPHMLKGIPAKLRDLRVYVDRPEFIINPTSCDKSQTDAELFGGGGNPFTTADDVAVFLSDRFQAANCAALGFKPRLGLKLKGGTKRGGHPGLQATYRPRAGNANVERLVVRLPRSAFLDQAHIRTICTRVQFAADSCPKAAQYGFIKAWTPLLEEPLQGPVWLRSSNNKLPDLVFDLHGLVDIEVATRIDSIRGGVRASVDQIPDAPLTKVVLRMQGGKKGLIVNSRNLCTSKNRANVESDGHNGKISDFNPVMRPDCGGKRKAKGHTAGHERQGQASG